MVRSTISRGSDPTISPHTVRDYVKAEPFRPFRIHLASARTFDIRHPEMVKFLKNHLIIFKPVADASEFPEEWDSVSRLLAASISHLEVQVL